MNRAKELCKPYILEVGKLTGEKNFINKNAREKEDILKGRISKKDNDFKLIN